MLSADHDAFALDTSVDEVALISVPVFCSRLVERLAVEAKDDWDESLINTAYPYFPPVRN